MTYLSHNDLLAALPEMNILARLPEYPFEADEQVKACSIDVRCDNVFWRLRAWPGPIDLAGPLLMEASPRRYWRKQAVPVGKSIRLQPGQLLLARTYERFSIPRHVAGKITGRSSYARLGLQISCTSDLINPGWSGQVSLQLVNTSVHTLLIHPLLPIAQIFLVPLSSADDTDYAASAKFKSKYLNDDGGPSYWWRDALVQKLRTDHLRGRIDQQAIELVQETTKKLDDEGVFRFEKFLGRTPLSEISNADDLLDDFARSEHRSKRIYQATRVVPWLFTALLLPTSVGLFYSSDPFGKTHWALFALTLVTGTWALVDWWWRLGEAPEFMTKVR